MLWDAERHADETRCRNEKAGGMVAWKVEPAVAYRRYADTRARFRSAPVRILENVVSWVCTVIDSIQAWRDHDRGGVDGRVQWLVRDPFRRSTG
jgi:hypothetical protein